MGTSQMNIADEVPVACDDCAWTGTAGQTLYIDDLAERLDPGTGEVPAGECPDCGSLAYVVKAAPRVDKHVARIEFEHTLAAYDAAIKTGGMANGAMARVQLFKLFDEVSK